MPKYAPELKEKAIQSMNEIGVKKTQEALGISVQTLYKWRNQEEAPAQRKQPEGLEEIYKLLMEDEGLLVKVSQLEAENSALRTKVAQLKKALWGMVE